MYDETFTLAPAPIDEAHPQLNGVSPGHSGVSGLSVTLMSRRRGSLPFTLNYFFPTSFFAVSTTLSTVNPR